MRDIYIPFKYKNLDFGITVQSFSVDSYDQTVEIEEYVISLDYLISESKPFPFDSVAAMINAMLDDGTHTQEVIFDTITETITMDMIDEELREAWYEDSENRSADRIDFYHNLRDDMI